jgi:hypothetical protein
MSQQADSGRCSDGSATGVELAHALARDPSRAGDCRERNTFVTSGAHFATELLACLLPFLFRAPVALSGFGHVIE